MQRRAVLRAGVGAAASLVVPRSFGQAAVEETIARVRLSVVALGTFRRTRTPAFRFLGTGFVVGDGSLVATNAHVVDGAKTLARDERLGAVLPWMKPGVSSEVAFRELRRVVEDRDHDLALLRLGGEPLPALALGASSAVREGRSVYFTGFPIGAVLGPVPVTHRAIVAAVTPIALPQGRAADLDAAVVRRIAQGAFPMFQLDGTAYPGNSGSPVFEASGEVIAILNMVFVKATKESLLAQPSGIAYAVPAEHLARLLPASR